MDKSLIKTIFTALLLVVITVNLTALQFSLVLDKTLFNPAFYDEIFLELHFYDQLRQWMLQRLSTELPHGREGLVYFQKALTDGWLRQEFILIMDQSSDFLEGKTDELPTLRIYKFKEAVMDHMYEYGDDQNKEKILDFWLGPLPHVVRLQDVTSIALLFNVRYAITLFNSVINISLMLVFVFFMLLFTATRHLRESLLWFGASLFASGLLSLAIAFFMGWFINSATAMQSIQTSMIAQGFHQDNVRALINFFAYIIVSRFNVVSFLSASIGFLLVCFVPLETEAF
jgi:hypothetical protein